MRNRYILFFVLFVAPQTGIPQSMHTTDSADLNLLSGLWYEIALFPADYREGSHCTTIEFEYIPGNRFLRATTRCIRFHHGNSAVSAKNERCYPSAGSNNLKLKVQSFWPLSANYEIIGLASDYNWMVMVKADHNVIAILSRDSFVPSRKYAGILKYLNDEGFNTSGIEKTPQNCDIAE